MVKLKLFSLTSCRCPFRLMRRCFLGRWICLPVSERFRLVWKCRLFDYSAYIPFCVHWHGGQRLRRLVPNYAVVFRLAWVYLPVSLCHRRSRRTDKIKSCFFQAAVLSILLYGCTTWTLTKRLEKKLDGNYTRMLRAILNKSRRQHPTKHQLYGRLPPITKTIQVRRSRHAGHCWRSRDELISDVLLWTPTYGRAKAGRPARTYIQQLCEDTGCSPDDLPEAMNSWEKWRERVRDIHASGMTWGWWWKLFSNIWYFYEIWIVFLWLLTPHQKQK